MIAYRHAAYDTPWWANASRREGRFHRPGDPPTQYWSLHPLGPAAEMLRHHIGPASLEDHDTLRLDLWVARLPDDGLLEIGFHSALSHGIPPDDLVADDYRSCQEWADSVRWTGAPGIAVPSAALPGTKSLVLFGPRVLHPYLAARIVPEEVPTGHLTDGARAAAGVRPLVRWFGRPHAGLDHWRRTGRELSLDDPVALRW